MTDSSERKKIGDLLRELNGLDATEKASVISSLLNDDQQLKSQLEKSFTQNKNTPRASPMSPAVIKEEMQDPPSSTPSPSVTTSSAVNELHALLNTYLQEENKMKSTNGHDAPCTMLPSPAPVSPGLKEEVFEPAATLDDPATATSLTDEIMKFHSAVEAMRTTQPPPTKAQIIEEEVILPPEWPRNRQRKPSKNRFILPNTAAARMDAVPTSPTTADNSRATLPKPNPATMVTDLETILNSYYNCKKDEAANEQKDQQPTSTEQLSTATPPVQQQLSTSSIPPSTPLTPPPTTEDANLTKLGLDQLINILQSAINTGTDPNMMLPNMWGEGSPPENNATGGGMVRGGKRKMFKGGAGECVRNNGTPYKKMKHSGGSHGIQLWQFMLELLGNAIHRAVLSWTGRGLEFRISNSVELARLWGVRKSNPIMNFDKLSRALRYYYEKNIIKHNPTQRLVYTFCENPDDVVYNALLNQALLTRPIEGEMPEEFEEVTMTPDDIVDDEEDVVVMGADQDDPEITFGPGLDESFGSPEQHQPVTMVTQEQRQPVTMVTPSALVGEAKIVETQEEERLTSSMCEALAELAQGGEMNLESVCSSLAASLTAATTTTTPAQAGIIAGSIPIKVETTEEWI